MATATCPKCDSRRFELSTAEPKGAKYKMTFVQCSSCGAVVGVTDYYSVPSLLEKIADKLGVRLFG